MMPSFWPRLVLLGLTWLVLILQLPGSAVAGGLLLAALYLAGYFVSLLALPPVARSSGRALACVAVVLSTFTLGSHLSGLTLVLLVAVLAGSVLVDEALTGTARWSLPTVLATALAVVVAVAFNLSGPDSSLHVYALLALVTYLIGAATAAFRRTESERHGAVERYGVLLSEYRDLKRVAAGSADSARAEERLNVARRLHDSVGHRLTSLLMQLEVDSLAADSVERRQRTAELKRLAQNSLDETRAAVSALSEEELAGMPALLRLIHNLEVESAMRIEFTVGSGALTVPLEQRQAVALYRAVQEALTNAMRHGASRRAKVRVEVPGGRVLRFEVENEVRQAAPSHVAGFGLNTMRQRVEDAGGELEILSGGSSFLVRGAFPVSS